MRDVVIGLDAGTSVIKAVAFDLEGRQEGVAARPNVYGRSRGGAHVEQDMAATWTASAAVLRQLADALRAQNARPVALAITGQGDGTWLIDAADAPAAPAILWLDARAAPLVEELTASGARARAYRYTGCGLNASNQSGHLLWLKRHQPEVLARSKAAMHCKDWLYLRLTGTVATDVSEGTFTFGDFRRNAYAPEVVEALGLGDLERLLPPMIDGTERTDPLTREAAALVGLPEGLPVALGAVDVICTALGGGLFDPEGRAATSIVGSTGMHMTLSPIDAVTLGDEPSGYVMPFPAEGFVSQMQTNMAATLNIDWAARLATDAAKALANAEVERGEALRSLDEAVLAARPGAALYHPYIDRAGERGPFVDGDARAMWSGLTSAVGFADLVRSVYEGLAFAAVDCYGQMSAAPQEIRMAGGGARSTALKTIFASALGLPVREVDRAEAGAAGAAMMALRAIGAFGSMREIERLWVAPTLGRTLAPDPDLQGLYAGLAACYRDLRRAMPPHWRALAQARGERA